MAIEVEMPKLSDTMDEGKILKWLKKEGEQVSSGDILAEIETDKADMEFETIDDGVLLKILKPEGSTAPVGDLIAIIGEEGEDISEYLDGDEEAKKEEPAEEEADEEAEDEEGADEAAEEEEEKEETAEEEAEDKTETEEDEAESEKAGEETAEEDEAEEVEEEEEKAEDEDEEAEDEEEDVDEQIRKVKDMSVIDEVPGDADKVKETAPTPLAAESGVKASPVARRLADEAGIDISKIKGSGPDGRVVKRDVQEQMGEAPKSKEESAEKKPAEKKAEPKKEAPKVSFEAPKALEGKRESMSKMRKTIGKRLVESKVQVPHFYLTVSVDSARLVEARESIKEQDGYTISVNDLIIKACATALLHHPMVNAHIDGDEIVYNDSVDIGVAVALDEGLITPYVRRAHEKGLGTIAQEVKELAGRARNRKLKPEEYSGGSMTVSNLGMFGIDNFTAIINPPESTILAVGQSQEVPVVVDGELTVGQRMELTLSCDHRLVDGAVGARFMQTLKKILENPMQMFV